MFESRASTVTTALLWELAMRAPQQEPARAQFVLSDLILPSGHAWHRPDSDFLRRLDLDPADLTPGEALSELEEVQRIAARVASAEVRLLVRAAGATRVVRGVLVEDLDADGLPLQGRDPRCVEMIDEAIDEIAAVLHRSSDQVYGQLHDARLLCGPLARTLDALSRGMISHGHARAIAAQVRRMEHVPLGEDPAADLVLAEACERLQARILPKAARLTVSQTRAQAARIVTSIDRAGAAARREQARLTCSVSLTPLEDGLALIEAVMPALSAAAVMAVIEARARDRITAGSLDGRERCYATPGQVRAAVLADLVTGSNPLGTNVEIGVVIDAATLAGLNPDGPAWVRTGSGQVDVDRDELIELLGSPDVHATLRRLVSDPASNALVDRGANRYRVSDSLRAWIQSRDLTCTFPGCNRSARRCDVDHAVDFADGGRTTIANTRALCRRHHNAKTHSGWRIADSRPDGSCVFISPSGHLYPHLPVPILEPALPSIPDPHPRDPVRAESGDPEPPPF